MSTYRFRVTRPHLAILAALALAFAFSVVGPARATIQTAPPKTTGISKDELSAVKGKCPKGTGVVSGGFSSPDFFSLGALVVRTSSVRAGNRGWRVTAAGLEGEEGRMVAHAYCDTEGLSLRVRKGTASIAAGQTLVVTARCRKGESVVSGGFATPGFKATGGPQVAIVSSQRVGKRAWAVEGANPDDTPGGPFPPTTLVAHAYCSADAPQIAIRRTTLNVTPSDQVGAIIDTPCRPGTKAIAGGFRGYLEIGPETSLGSTAISSTRLAKGRGWRTEVFAVAENGPVPLTGFAYCVKA